ncbi:hypothetical protein ACG2F4_04975 [Halalkalibaculum sp. DA3122]|uniref:hypothetical protein n=1 Tax=unclassified Halalkalibaculum TaxID=2964617 RepID=UPI0037544360
MDDNTPIQMLGSSEELEWSQKGNNLQIVLPADYESGAPAYSFNITPEPYSMMRTSQ